MTRVIPPHRRDPDDSHDSQYYRRGVDDIRNVITSTTEPLGAEPGTLWYNPEGVPDYGVDIGISKDDADELYTSKDEFAAVADVPPRVEAVEQATERLDTLTYDVERFVPAAETRADAWQAAIDTAHAAGGGTVTSSRPGTHAMPKGLTLRDNVYLDLPSVHLDFSGMTAPVSGSAIYGEGGMTPLPAFAPTISKHDRAITFASMPDVSRGDLLLIYNSADFSFSPSRNYYRAGEFVRVQSVSGDTVTLATSLYDTYAAGGTTTIYKVTPIRTAIHGGRMTFRPGSDGIRIVRGSGIVIQGLSLTGTNNTHLALRQCYGVSVSGCVIVDHSPSVGLNYGIGIHNSQRIALTDNFIEATRHGVTHGGGTLAGDVPNREVTISGGTISSNGGSFGLDVHGNAEYVSIDNVHLPMGTDLMGDHISITNCTIRAAHVGRAIDCTTEPLGSSYRIENNDITVASTASTTMPGAICFWFREDAIRDGHLIIRGNRITYEGYAVNGYPTNAYGAINVYNSASTAQHDVTIEENVISGGPTTPGPAWGVWVRVSAPMSYRDIRVNGNTLDRFGISVDTNARSVDAANNAVTDSPCQGVMLTPKGVPSIPPKRIRAVQNVVERPWKLGIYVRGHVTESIAELRSNRIEDWCMGGNTGTSAENAAFYLRTLQTALVSDNTLIRPAPFTAQRAYSYNDIGMVDQRNTMNLSTVTTTSLTAVTTHYLQERGTGAPTVACADGSTYLRTDGGEGATLYVREGGAWVAK